MRAPSHTEAIAAAMRVAEGNPDQGSLQILHLHAKAIGCKRVEPLMSLELIAYVICLLRAEINHLEEQLSIRKGRR